MPKQPYTAEDFSWVHWTPADIERAAEAGLARKRRSIEDVKAIPGQARTFDNTIAALETGDYQLRQTMNWIDLLLNVSPDAGIREAAKKTIDAVNKESIELAYDEGIFQALEEYQTKQEALAPDQKKFFTELYRDYLRMGFKLNPELRHRIKELFKQLTELSVQFSKNINDWQDQIILVPDQTAGLPAAYLEGLQKDAEGSYIITIAYPDYFSFMQNSTVPEKRKELADKFSQRGGQKNMELLKQILALRHEVAKILGYKTYGDYVTEVKMAKNADTVYNFVSDLMAKVQPAVNQEMEVLRTLKRTETKDSQSRLEYYDLLYYMNQLKKQHYQVDDEAVRQYFPLERVLHGMFEIYATIFSLVFTKIETLPAWHPDVTYYQVTAKDNSLIGYFALDLHPREGKYSHAAEFGVIPSHHLDGQPVATCAVMVANFAKPTPERPSLLKHEEVETLFHEFGHVMHEVLAESRYWSQAGTTVARDFVEAPSQMLENWVWDKDMLQLMSGHWQDTTKKLPDDLAEKLIKTKDWMIAYWVMRQMIFAMFDITLHTSHDTALDIEDLYQGLVKTRVGIQLPPTDLFPAGFGHLMGYDAGYYGYMWSKVYAADMFTRFEREGVLNAAVGKEYRDKILAPGSTKEEIDMVRDFLGREPNNQAFLKELGIN
jgi:thimet oligopeptidase